MTQVEAIYADGVFRPLRAVSLSENKRVRLSIHPVEPSDARNWLSEAQALQRRIIGERGCFPDSTPDIAADRSRDE